MNRRTASNFPYPRENAQLLHLFILPRIIVYFRPSVHLRASTLRIARLPSSCNTLVQTTQVFERYDFAVDVDILESVSLLSTEESASS